MSALTTAGNLRTMESVFLYLNSTLLQPLTEIYIWQPSVSGQKGTNYTHTHTHWWCNEKCNWARWLPASPLPPVWSDPCQGLPLPKPLAHTDKQWQKIMKSAMLNFRNLLQKWHYVLHSHQSSWQWGTAEWMWPALKVWTWPAECSHQTGCKTSQAHKVSHTSSQWTDSLIHIWFIIITTRGTHKDFCTLRDTECDSTNNFAKIIEY